LSSSRAEIPDAGQFAAALYLLSRSSIPESVAMIARAGGAFVMLRG
jgi:hypothetical protein